MSAKAYQAKRPVGQLLPSGVANRLVTTPDGVTMAMAQATTTMLGTGAVPRTATKIVAAVNASAQMLAAADYVCDGVADEVQINAALAALPAAGGTVQLSEGTFTLADRVVLSGARQALRGMGMAATTLAVVNAAGAPINTGNGMVHISADYCEASDFTFDGNKVNNASATAAVCLYQYSGIAPLFERVRIVNSSAYGIVTYSQTNGTVRDCLIENSAGHGILLRAPVGSPLTVSGCTSKGNTLSGFFCGGGPAVLSDCSSLSNADQGFLISSANVSITNCTSRSNGSVGFSVNGANAILTGCRSESNTSHGFYTTGAGTQFIGCMASMSSVNAHGFFNDTGATDTLYSGCVAQDTPMNYACFMHSSAGKSTYVGCRLLNFIHFGFRPTAGEIHVRNCYGYGSNIYSTFVQPSGGANHVIDGCRTTNNGGFGVYVEAATVTNVQITNNFISNSSLISNSYEHIRLGGDRAFVHGNVLRDPPSGTRPLYGIRAASVDSFIGLNQTAGAGTAGEVLDAGTNTRQLVKMLLDYTTTTDLLNAVALTAGVWIDAIPDQTFRVENSSNRVEIACWGSLSVASQVSIASAQTQLIIDATTVPVTRLLGYEHFEAASGVAQNVMAGANPIKITNMLVGNHTVKLQVRSAVNAVATLLAATVSTGQTVNIQVTEHAI